MTECEFAYWLQGAFEIAGVDRLDEEQTSCVHRHIALVRVTAPRSSLCIAVEALLEAGEPVERARLVRVYLARHFQHVIDPQHPNPAAADLAHVGEPAHHTHDHHTVYRC